MGSVLENPFYNQLHDEKQDAFSLCLRRSPANLVDKEWGEVVVAQLAERSLAIPEDPGSNPVIGNFY